MGSGQSREGRIGKNTPLGCVLRNWSKLGGHPLTQKKLVAHCQCGWAMYKLVEKNGVEMAA